MSWHPLSITSFVEWVVIYHFSDHQPLLGYLQPRVNSCCRDRKAGLDSRRTSPNWPRPNPPAIGNTVHSPDLVTLIPASSTAFSPGSLPPKATCVISLEKVCGIQGIKNGAWGLPTSKCSNLVRRSLRSATLSIAYDKADWQCLQPEIVTPHHRISQRGTASQDSSGVDPMLCTRASRGLA